MNGAFDHYNRQELLTLLRTWNDQLARYEAIPVVDLDAAIEIGDLGALRSVIVGTEARLAEVARVLGPLS